MEQLAMIDHYLQLTLQLQQTLSLQRRLQQLLNLFGAHQSLLLEILRP
jgi:hypothetical protein